MEVGPSSRESALALEVQKPTVVPGNQLQGMWAPLGVLAKGTLTWHAFLCAQSVSTVLPFHLRIWRENTVGMAGDVSGV